MQDIKAYCFKCSRQTPLKDPIKVKFRNRKSKTGTVDAWRGKCDACGSTNYRIIGNG